MSAAKPKRLLLIWNDGSRNVTRPGSVLPDPPSPVPNGLPVKITRAVSELAAVRLLDEEPESRD